MFTYTLLIAAAGLFAIAAGILAADGIAGVRTGQPIVLRRRLARRFATAGAVLLLPALAIVVVPTGSAAVRVSQWTGAVKGPLYAGTHLVVPFAQDVEVYNVRDQVYSTIPIESPKDRTPVLKVYSREGLAVGLGVTVRYQL